MYAEQKRENNVETTTCHSLQSRKRVKSIILVTIIQMSLIWTNFN